MASEAPDIRYAQSGDVSIAYAVQGDGPIHIVFVHGYISNLEVEWEEPRHRAFFGQLATTGALIRFDRRGSGLSDRVRDVPTLETRMDDLRAVMDAAPSERAVLVATFEAASMTMLFAATYPERVAGLVLYNPIAKGVWSADYPFAPTEDEHLEELQVIRRSWGRTEAIDEFLRDAAPSVADDPEVRAWAARIFRQGASPGAALAIRRMVMNVDVRDVLPSIRVPTLVAHERRTRDEASFIARRIPNSRLVELTGDDRVFWLAEGLPEEIAAFARTAWGKPEPDTVLATVLFTDIVGSTAKAATLGDRSWAELIQHHHTLVRSQLDRYRGREIDTAGDGFFAAFDGPIRAIRCAVSVRDTVRDLGVEMRAGLHTGECELVGEKLSGLAVNIGARVAARADSGEVLVSQTVRDLVAGSGLILEDRGTAELKGVPGEWRLYAVAAGEPVRP